MMTAGAIELESQTRQSYAVLLWQGYEQTLRATWRVTTPSEWLRSFYSFGENQREDVGGKE
jgi:hypothetical protein